MKTKTYTAQQIFNKVVRHLRRQGVQAMSASNSVCVYLAPDGKRCAVGCLAKPGSLNAYEGQGVGGVIAGLYVDRPNSTLLPVLLQHRDLLYHLQDAHDHRTLDSWESEFVDIAREFSLTVPKHEVAK